MREYFSRWISSWELRCGLACCVKLVQFRLQLLLAWLHVEVLQLYWFNLIWFLFITCFTNWCHHFIFVHNSLLTSSEPLPISCRCCLRFLPHAVLIHQKASLICGFCISLRRKSLRGHTKGTKEREHTSREAAVWAFCLVLLIWPTFLVWHACYSGNKWTRRPFLIRQDQKISPTA